MPHDFVTFDVAYAEGFETGVTIDVGELGKVFRVGKAAHAH